MRDGKGDGEKSVTSMVPKKASSDTTELRTQLRAVREAVSVEGGHEDRRRSPPAVPRTRRSKSVQSEQEGPGRRAEDGDHFSSRLCCSR